MKRLTSEFSRVISCDHCLRAGYPKLLRDESFNLPYLGYIGSSYKDNGVLLVGQNPGISPVRFAVQDRDFADAVVAVGQSANAQTMARLKDIQDRIIPTWPVVTNYFPLAECGLRLDDIAYTNVVRCRTQENATPGVRVTRLCIDKHFVRWFDWLRPRVVVCIGKWAHDQIFDLLESRGVPHGFINRSRSLSTAERQENLKSVVGLVSSVLSGKLPNEASSTLRPMRVPAQPRPSVQLSTKRPDRMNVQGYADILEDLGFHSIEIGKTLKHWRRSIPSLYFNSRCGEVFFAGWSKDRQRFSPRLWKHISPPNKRHEKPNVITIVPKPGRERDAFEDLIQ